MDYQLKASTAYVDADGQIGVGALLTFNPEDLTNDEWDTLNDLRGNERMEYVFTLLNKEQN